MIKWPVVQILIGKKIVLCWLGCSMPEMLKKIIRLIAIEYILNTWKNNFLSLFRVQEFDNSTDPIRV